MNRNILILFAAVWLGISLAFYACAKYFAYNLWPGNTWFGVFKWGYILAELLVTGQLFGTIYNFRRKAKPKLFTLNSTMVILLLWLLPRLAFIVGTGLATIVLATVWQLAGGGGHSETLLRLEAALAAAITLFVLAAVWQGLTAGKYSYKVKRIKLRFKNLPQAFNGFTITHFSDVHAGSLDITRAKKGVQMLNGLESDLVVFTGDLVNNSAAELDGWQELLGSIKAPYGVYSILGNHDYGDYTQWASPQAKQANLARLVSIERSLGFDVLLNEHRAIVKNGQAIYLAGVENWGAKGFAQYGKLAKALAGIPQDGFTILLSHDPSHWEAEVLKATQVPALTLAGHTHGFQFGINVFNWMWSPIKWFYKHWGGLYARAGHYLYINLGFGFHGLPGRIGMRPELTVITLLTNNNDEERKV